MFVIFFPISTPECEEEQLAQRAARPDCLLICEDLSGRLHHCISKLQAACLLRAWLVLGHCQVSLSRGIALLCIKASVRWSFAGRGLGLACN